MMEFQTTPGDRLGHLLSTLVDGELRDKERSPAFAEELAGLLRSDPQARREYIQWMSLHAHLLGRMPHSSALDTDSQQPIPACVLPSSREPSATDVPHPDCPSPVFGFAGDWGRQGWNFISDHSIIVSAIAVLVLVGRCCVLEHERRKVAGKWRV